MAGGTFSILRSVRGYHIYKEICSQGKFREFEPLAKIAKISPREIFPPYLVSTNDREMVQCYTL